MSTLSTYYMPRTLLSSCALLFLTKPQPCATGSKKKLTGLSFSLQRTQAQRGGPPGHFSWQWGTLEQVSALAYHHTGLSSSHCFNMYQWALPQRYGLQLGCPGTHTDAHPP